MSYYHKLGKIPPKRHTQFRDASGELYAEELVSSKGFSGIYSILYHQNPPTRVFNIQKPITVEIDVLEPYELKQTHLNTSKVNLTGKDFILDRVPLMTNADVTIYLSCPSEKSMDVFYKNGEADELLFIHEGEGVLHSQFGTLKVRQGDYVVIPRTTIFRMEWENDPIKVLILESSGPIETVKRYRNELGQLLEHSPYCERDIRPPEELIDYDLKSGEYLVRIKKQGHLHNYVYDQHPFDLVGWDGFLYPYALSIHDFEPITGRIHQPPPVHQTFQGTNYVICSFVPRLFDYHPLAIPAPYNHSNIDSDEVLYYAEGNFMSRKGIDRGSFTLHPGGLPHGPHPGTVEKSIGAKETEELAVMIDTFKPLHITQQAKKFIDENYPWSWTE
ncbi:MAG: homogentisate 1,2-dioxygenase [Bacteroidota bacterium]